MCRSSSGLRDTLIVSRSWDPDDRWDPRNPENRDRTRVLVGQLRTRLLAWDPIGVATVPEAQDEYDCLISPLLHLLHDGADEGEVRNWLVSELTDHFGMTPNEERESALAGSLTAWWRRATSNARP